MRYRRWVAIAAVLGTAVVGFGAVTATAGAQSTGGGASDSDIGVTPSTIRVAVVADVDVPVDPGLFAGSVAGVQGFAKYINAHGGIDGRKLQVDFIDSKLSDSDAQSAVIQACSQDFALVGTSALFLNSVSNMQACKDKTGATTGLPDIPVVTTEVVQQCNPESYPINPPSIICSTQNDHPQTYQGNIGRAYYYQSKYGKLHGVYIFSSDLKAAHDSSLTSGIGGVRYVGIKSDEDFSLSAMAPQSAYTTVIQTMKNDNSNYFGTGNAFNSMVLARKEATLQGITGVKVWDCTLQCYTPDLISQGGSDVNGTYVTLLFLPFNETGSNSMLANFVKYTAKAHQDGFAIQAWAAADLFADAATKALKADGPNGLTRKNLFQELDTEHSFTAGGMLGTTDVAGRKTTPCEVILQVQNGKFVRVFPTKAGTFNCDPKNYKTYKVDLSP